MKRFIKIVSSCFILFILTASAYAQTEYHGQEYPVDIHWEVYALPRSEQSIAVMILDIQEGWHTYASNTGEVGKPTTLKAAIKPGSITLDPIFPQGKRQPDAFAPSKTAEIYEGETHVFLPIPPNTPKQSTITAQLDLLFCSETKCLPAQLNISFAPATLNAHKLEAADLQPWWPEFVDAMGETSSSSGTATALQPEAYTPALEVGDLGTALLFGLIAGLLLNLMPCVLPVISLKLSALLGGSRETPEESRRAVRSHGIFFAAGILTWFGALAIILWKTGIAWGEIFQQSSVVSGLAIFVFLMSLSLLGLFNLPVIDLKLDRQTHSPKAQAYFTGLLATLLATPCSGPFLGGVLAWALLQPPIHIAAVFMAVGLGMSLPYLIMAIFPGMASRLPKPGAWVKRVEQIAAFLLLGTALYLVNILPQKATMPVLFAMWLSVPAGWLWGLAGPGADTVKRWTLRIAGLLILGGTLFWLFSPKAETFQWEMYNPATFETQLGEQAVFVDFTADWCPTCKVIEATVLTQKNLAEWNSQYPIRFVRVDLSTNNPAGEDLLYSLGSRSIPTAAFFPSGKNRNKPVVLRDIFTKEQVETIFKSYK